MSSFEIGASRPVDAVQSNSVLPASTGPIQAQATSTTAATGGTTEVQTAVSTSAGSAPVDQDRVNQIRQAVQDGQYPLIPTKVGDAMIAAGVMLRRQS
jgi:negative regulator of flagellin synthesis FlgM